jgi:hypothetical protein
MLYVYPNSTHFREQDNQVTPDGPIKITHHLLAASKHLKQFESFLVH